MDQNSAHTHGSGSGDTYDGTYGTQGIYRAVDFYDAEGDYRTVMGIHAGRSEDVNYPTFGSIRTTEQAMSIIQQDIQNYSPLTSITVTN